MRKCVDGIGILTAAAVAISGLAIGPASSQTDIARMAIAKAEAAAGRVKAACATELKSYCSMVTPGDGRVLLCMLAHEDKIGDKCFEAFIDVAESVELAISNIGRAAEVCGADVKKHCAKVQEGQGRVAQCLLDNKATLSAVCRGEVTSFEGRIKK